MFTKFMTPESILSSFRNGLAAELFTIADIHRATGIPQSTLQGLRDGPRAPRLANRLTAIGEAICKLGADQAPTLKPGGFFQQPVFDHRRRVREQIADVERDLAARDLAVSELCRRAGVTFRTWNRWKAGDHEPAYSVWVRVLDAAQSMIELAAVDAADVVAS